MGWCSSVHPIRSKAIPAVLPRLMEACGHDRALDARLLS